MITSERKSDYGSVVQKALRNVVHDILLSVEKNGLAGDQHFYITFATNHPWVELPDYLKKDYPTEMTIVLQYEFWDLTVGADKFSVNLYFDDVSERLTIPFSAIISFVDPSAKFGLQFVADYDGDESGSNPFSDSDRKTNNPAGSNVVSLDDFRKK